MVSRRLYILRHARADAPPYGGSDRDRPLTESGRCAARALACKMQQAGFRIQAILCSPARRARETLAPILALWPEAALDTPESLYLAGTGDLYEMIRAQDNAHQDILLVGHNPGLHSLARFLSGAGAPELMLKLMAGYSPGTLAVIVFDVENWSEIMPGGGRLVDLFAGEERP